MNSGISEDALTTTTTTTTFAYVDDPANWALLLEAMRPKINAAPTLEAAAQIATRSIYEALSETTALVRIYAIVPRKELPPDVGAFVDAIIAPSAPPNETDKPPTTSPKSHELPVLALLGTHGTKAEWCDRRLSEGHKGIPLVSQKFVEAIPMLARLLRELGIDLAWLDDAPEVITRRLLGGFNGLFYVEDAKTVRDGKGRLVIPAVDFVASEDVKTVFGMGGTYPNGTTIVCIIFTRETLLKSTVERLTSLISMLKGETFGVVRTRRFFTP